MDETSYSPPFHDANLEAISLRLGHRPDLWPNRRRIVLGLCLPGRERGACGRLRRHPLMLRFSPGESPGLASPAGEEPPPRSLGPRTETHTLISQYSIVTFFRPWDFSKPANRRQGELSHWCVPSRRARPVRGWRRRKMRSPLRPRGADCPPSPCAPPASPLRAYGANLDELAGPGRPYTNGRRWTTVPGLDSGRP
jgi:hypothetical protein